jgi:7-cyano-7-deazaguanine synthase
VKRNVRSGRGGSRTAPRRSHSRLAGKSATVLMSGGLDSMVCAHLLATQGQLVEGLFVDFGQSACTQERRAVTRVCNVLNIPLRTVRVRGLASFSTGEITGRNAFLIFAATLARGAAPGLISIGVHAGTRYFDCSKPFLEAMARLLGELSDGRVGLAAPLSAWTKQEVHAYASRALLPIDLTYSCERGGKRVCGRCASCRDRKSLKC